MHDFVHGDWSQRRIALAHGVSERGLAARAGCVPFPGLSQFCTLVYRLLTMLSER